MGRQLALASGRQADVRSRRKGWLPVVRFDLGLTVCGPVAPLADFRAAIILTFSGKLAVLMVVAPDTLLDALFVAAFGCLNAIWVIRHEEAVPYPAGTVRRHFARIAKANFAILVRDLRDIQVGHGGIVS